MYCMSLFRKRNEDLLFKSYMADVVMAIANATGRVEIRERFIDLLPTYKEPEPEKSAEQIVEEIMARAGLSFEDEDDT